MGHFHQQTVENLEFILTDKEQNYLGPDLVLTECHLILTTNARALTIVNAQFLNCHIEAKKKLKNFQMWCAAVIKGCRFTGQFVGNDFGRWSEQHSNGQIESSDFSHALLDGCRFMGCNIESIKLPKWPCFTILNPHQQQAQLDSVEWPGKLRFWANDLPSQPNITAGLVEYAPTLAKQFSCSEEELRAALIRLGGVLL